MPVTTRPGRRAMRRAWRRRHNVLALATATLMGMVLLAAPSSTAAPADPAARSGTITINSPANGSTVPRASIAAARAARVPVLVSFGPDVTVTSAQLNGQSVTGLRRIDHHLLGVVGAADGVRPGLNTLSVSGSRPGVRLGVEATSRFVVTYPSANLIDFALGSQAAGVLPTARVSVPRSGIFRATVSVNGHDVTAALFARRLQDGEIGLSAADFLRAGSNRISLNLVMTDGRTQTLTRLVTLDPRRAIPGVRIDTGHVGGVEIGHLVRLDAGTSIVPKGVDRTHVSWQLVTRPAGSSARLSASTGVQAAFTPDRPGVYRVQVTVGSGANAGTTTLAVTATYPQKLVALNTIDTSTNPSAITIGGTRYPNSGGINVLIVNRASLAPITSMPAQQSFGTTSSELSRLSTFLKNLESDPQSDTYLVFLTHPSASPTISSSDLATLNTALGYIGGGWAGYWQYGNNVCWSGQTFQCYDSSGKVSQGWVRQSQDPIGSFSVAGVPGMAAGQAWRNTAIQSRSAEGAITGYLTRGTSADPVNPEDYTIVAGRDQYVQVDTCASGGPSACVIKVGNQSFAPDAGANGMNLVVLDRTTQTLIMHKTVTSIDQLVVALQNSNVATQKKVGRTVVMSYNDDDQRIVLLQSVGNGKLAHSNSNIMPFIDRYGGTPEVFLDAFTNGTPYALVGVADHLPWHGTATESSPMIPVGNGKGSGHVRTVLSRGRDWLLTPDTGDTVSALATGTPGVPPANLDLFSIAYQDPTAWPYAGDPAVADIAQQLNLDPDIRSDYTDTLPPWATYSGSVLALSCKQPTGCGPNYDAVKQELSKEFIAVADVNNLITQIQMPLNLQGISQHVDVAGAYANILKSLSPPGSSSSSFDFLNLFTESTSIGSAFAFAADLSGAGTALGLLSAIGEFFEDISPSSSRGAPGSLLIGTVNSLENQLATQQEAWVEGTLRLRDILVDDAGKLLTVDADIRQPDAFDKGWSWTSDSTIFAVQALNANTISESYRAMLPTKWGMFSLVPDLPDNMPSDNVSHYTCAALGQGTGPALWANTPPGNRIVTPTFVDTSKTAYVGQTWTYSNINTGNFIFNPAGSTQVPTVDFSDPLFAAKTNGGYQYAPQWFRETYNPPGSVACTPLALFNEASVAWAVPVIPNAQAAATS
jgi:hypothetical protein